MAKKRRSKRKPSRDSRVTYTGGYSPKRRVNLADLPKDMFRPKTTDELVNGSHS